MPHTSRCCETVKSVIPRHVFLNDFSTDRAVYAYILH